VGVYMVGTESEWVYIWWEQVTFDAMMMMISASIISNRIDSVTVSVLASKTVGRWFKPPGVPNQRL
jgi:hypothetical protein